MCLVLCWVVLRLCVSVWCGLLFVRVVCCCWFGLICSVVVVVCLCLFCYCVCFVLCVVVVLWLWFNCVFVVVLCLLCVCAWFVLLSLVRSVM